MHDQVMVADQREGGVVGVVEPLAPYLAVKPGDLRDCLLPPAAAALLAGQVTLGRREPLTGGRQVARVADVRAVAGGQERRHAQVDAGRGSGRLQWLGGHVVARQHYVPAVTLPLGGDGLHPALDGPVLVDADVADALEVDAGDGGVWHGVPAGAVFL